MEYGYGAHDFPVSGVFEVEPKSCPGFIFRCSIPLGHIKMPPSEFRTFIESVASEYHGDTYHLITKNCNHFTDDIVYRMTGKHIPGWVNRLAWLGMLHFLRITVSIHLLLFFSLCFIYYQHYHELGYAPRFQWNSLLQFFVCLIRTCVCVHGDLSRVCFCHKFFCQTQSILVVWWHLIAMEVKSTQILTSFPYEHLLKAPNLIGLVSLFDYCNIFLLEVNIS